MRADERPKDERELHWGEKVYVTSATLLLAFTFLDWFRTTTPGTNFTGSPWLTLHSFLVILVLVILITFLAASGKFNVNFVILGERMSKNSIVAIAGMFAMMMLFVCIISPPKLIDFSSGQKISTAPELGLYLSFAAAIGIAFGGSQAARAEAALTQGEGKGRAKSIGDDSPFETSISDTDDESDDRGEDGPLLG